MRKKNNIKAVTKKPLQEVMIDMYDTVREFIDMTTTYHRGYLMDLSRPHLRQICVMVVLTDLEEKDQATIRPGYQTEIDQPLAEIGVVIRKYPAADVRWPDGIRITFFDHQETRILVWEPHASVNGVLLPSGQVVCKPENEEETVAQIEKNFKLLVWALNGTTVSLRPLSENELHLIPNNISAG